MTDLQSKIVHSGTTENLNYTIDTNTLQNGLYFVRVQCKGTTQIKKVLIQH